MKLTMLGTGNAAVTNCYNTCFILNENNDYFLVDCGGGNQILKQLKDINVNIHQIKHIFITHKHVDHLLGCFWIIRMLLQKMSREGFAETIHIYGHEEVIQILKNMSYQLFNKKETSFIDKQLCFITIKDKEEKMILNHKVTFFDIHSSKAKQFGFTMELDNHEKLTCLGDEPYNEYEEEYVKNSKWLLHEAFCLYAQADVFKPYQKHHSTVKEACEIAKKYNVENLILYHSEDKNITNRKELYYKEGIEYYKGNLYIPDDLESFVL
jgi:ribonuclease Z